MAATICFYSRPVVETNGTGATSDIVGGCSNIEMDTTAATLRRLGVAGDMSDLWVKVTRNGTTAASTFTLRDDGVDTSLEVTIASGTTGEFEDTTNTASLVADDDFSFRMVNGGGGEIDLQQFAHLFDADTDTATIAGCNSQSVNTLGSTADTFFSVMGARAPSDFDTVAITFDAALTWAGLCANVANNSADGAHTVESHDDGVDGNQLVTITAGADGWYEDGLNTDTVSSGSELAYHVTGVGTTGTVGYEKIGSVLITTSDAFFNFFGGGNNSIQGPQTGLYWGITSGESGATGTETNADYPAPFAFTWSDFRVKSDRHSGGYTATWVTRVNGAPGNQLVVLSNDGETSDTTNTDSVSIDDELCYELSMTGDGRQRQRHVGAVATHAAGGQTVVVGLASETDTALAVTPERLLALNLATEADTALPVAHIKTVQVGLANEVNSGLAVQPERIYTLGLSSEVDSALPVTPVLGAKIITVGIAPETDSALGATPERARTLGLASETDTALSVTPQLGVKIVTVGLASEADSAQPVQPLRTIAVGQASEADTALPVAAGRAVNIGIAATTDTAFALGHSKAVQLGIASEVDTALPLIGVGGAVTAGIIEFLASRQTVEDFSASRQTTVDLTASRG